MNSLIKILKQPRFKQFLILLLSGSILLLLIYFLTSTPELEPQRTKVDNKIFIAQQHKDLSLLSLSNRVNNLEPKLLQQEQQLQVINQQLKLLNQKLDELRSQATQNPVALNSQEVAKPSELELDPLLYYSKNPQQVVDKSLSAIIPTPNLIENNKDNWQLLTNQPVNPAPPQLIEPVTPQIYTYHNSSSQLLLPATSVLSGTLVNGVDAPTNNGAQGQPYPVLLTINDLTVIPNYRRLNLAGCFVLLSSYGELSSQRAMMRAELLSCTKQDGQIIEAPLKAFAVGKDGKIGIAGRLVSKQGSVIARSLASGFISSMGSNLTPKRLLTHNNNLTNLIEPTSNNNNAFDKLADYYLQLANSMFPIIEVNAGQAVELVVSANFTMDLNSKNSYIPQPLKN